MLLETSWVPRAASWTLRAISAVAMPCCSTAAAMAVAISFTEAIVASISSIGTDGFFGCFLDRKNLLADFAGRLRGLLRERLHFGGHHGKASAGFAGARRLDGGIQGQEVGLPRDGVDELDDIAEFCCAALARPCMVAPDRLACSTAKPVILVDSVTWRPISLTDDVSSSVEDRDSLHVGGCLFGSRSDGSRLLGGLFGTGGQRVGGALQIRRRAANGFQRNLHLTVEILDRGW